jgi:hypothetical protein
MLNYVMMRSPLYISGTTKQSPVESGGLILVYMYIKVSNHQLISLRFSTKFVFFQAYLVILS